MMSNITDGIEIIIDPGFEKWSSFARRPYYQLRGRPVTEKQAFDIISRTDNFFYLSGLEEAICPVNFNMWWFNSNHYPEKYGWVHPSGLVGINDITGKYPDTEEFICEWYQYLRHFPYLDLVIAVTGWDELSPERWNVLNHYVLNDMKKYNIYQYREYDDFFENIRIGIWVHDRKIEIMNPERTERIYKYYSKKNNVRNKKVYNSMYYMDYQPDVITMDYLHRCLSSYGIKDPAAFLNEKVRPYEIENIRPGTIHG